MWSYLLMDITALRVVSGRVPAWNGVSSLGTVGAGNLRRWGITDGWLTTTRFLISLSSVLLLSVPPGGGATSLLPHQAPPLHLTHSGPAERRAFPLAWRAVPTRLSVDLAGEAT